MAEKAAGYNLLALIMGAQPDFAIFRRFLVPNARNLLRLQGEIINLEGELEAIICADRNSDDAEKRIFDFCIAALKGPPHTSPDRGLQWKVAANLDNKLRVFNAALLQFKELCALPSANKLDLATLRELLNTPGSHDFPLECELYTWAEKHEADLTSLTGRCHNKDALSKWIDSQLIPWYHKHIGHCVHDPLAFAEAPEQILITHYSDSMVSATVNTISTILSSLLPIASIFALYFIHNPLARMGAIVLFSFFFSTILAVIAKARRVDCFAATAAFAAVQVVFIATSTVKD